MLPFQSKLKILFIFATLTLVAGVPYSPNIAVLDGYDANGDATGKKVSIQASVDGVLLTNETANTVVITRDGMDKVPESYINEAMETIASIFTMAMATQEDEEEGNDADALKLYFQGMGYIWALKNAFAQSSRTQDEADAAAAYVDENCAQYYDRAEQLLDHFRTFTAKSKEKEGKRKEERIADAWLAFQSELGSFPKPTPTRKPARMVFSSL